MNFFLLTQSDNLSSSLASAGNVLSTVILFAKIMLAILFLVWLMIYVYMSFAYMAIAKKSKQKLPGLAWIPGVGPLIVAFNASKMHWWPWLLLIGTFLPLHFISVILGLVFLVFIVIWHWKMFESIGKDGWWAILLLIPVVNLIMIGIAAWSKK